MRLPNHVIVSECGNFHIGVPQCDHEWANVFVSFADKHKAHTWGNSPIYRKVFLKNFSIEEKSDKVGHMPFDAYQRVVQENKNAVLQLIEVLNGAS